MYARTANAELSFKGEPLIRERHKIHPFPAMLHPLLVNHLIKSEANDGDIIFDPFCGSGVTLLQASLCNHRSIGFDINPLALLISRTKNNIYEIRRLRAAFEEFKNDVSTTYKTDTPTTITNIDYWYTADTQRDLGRIRYTLGTKSYDYHDFFQVCFAYICRQQSLTRKGEFKRYRIKEEKIKEFRSDVLGLLFTHIEAMIGIIEKTEGPVKYSKIYLKNAEESFDKRIKYDFVITSPPYGDSRTTVAYGQYCSFGLEWIKGLIGPDNVNYNIDNECMGKVGHIDERIYKNEFLCEILTSIESVDKKRAKDVLYFFNGYYKALQNITKNLSKNGKLAFVVGNRTVKGYQIPMDQITARFFEDFGLEFKNILVRDISNKVMPSRNSPTNIAGKTNRTMENEYVVMFEKNCQTLEN